MGMLSNHVHRVPTWKKVYSRIFLTPIGGWFPHNLSAGRGGVMVHSVGGVVYVYTQNIFISGEGVLTLRIILSMVILTTQKYFIGGGAGRCLPLRIV